jgi:hypothetical protein
LVERIPGIWASSCTGAEPMARFLPPTELTDIEQSEFCYYFFILM